MLSASYQELAELYSRHPDDVPVDQALGLLTALASIPRNLAVPLDIFIEELISKKPFNTSAEKSRLKKALQASYADIVAQLDRGTHAGPPNSEAEAFRLWCEGYFWQWQSYPPVWNDANMKRLLAHFGALGGLGSSELGIAEDSIEEFKTRSRALLPSLLRQLHARWKHTPSWKTRTGASPKRPGTHHRSTRKVGRNAPCPCNSGQKYKRCCGQSRAAGAKKADQANPTADRTSTSDRRGISSSAPSSAVRRG